MEEKITKSMEDITEFDLMREFMTLTGKPLQPNELTVKMFMEYMKVPRNKARYTLSKYEQSGLLKVRKVTIGGNAMNAYLPTEGTWKEVVEKIKNKD